MSAALLVVACGDGRPGSDGDESDSLLTTMSGSSSGGEEGSGSETEGETDPAGPKFDVGFDDPQGCQSAQGQGGDYDFSTIWIANSPEGTVSKIDTRSGAELARYVTGPEADPDPSRTSVNLQGNVAVGNRAGSIAMIATRQSDCADRDGDGQITTSQGADDVLAWGADECVLWHHDTPFAEASHTGGPRAVAWDAGEPTAGDCVAPNPRVWVGWRAVPDDTVVLRRLDGATGEVDAEVMVEDWDGRWGHGSYGGAVDGDNNFWALGTWSTLVRVDSETLDVDRWENPGHNAYGIALDADGNPWLAGYDGRLTHFDVETETFVEHDAPGTRLRGIQIDRDGFAWVAANDGCGLVKFDIAADQLVDGAIALPGCDTPVGVSIDVDGYVWVVDREADQAYKVDPNDYATTTVTGLVGPYTYSDMTGAGLSLVFQPEG